MQSDESFSLSLRSRDGEVEHHEMECYMAGNRIPCVVRVTSTIVNSSQQQAAQRGGES